MTNYFKNGVKCGPFGSALKKSEFTTVGIPVWNMDNIVNYEFNDSPNLFVNDKKYIELESYKVEIGDIIISRAGTVGKMCIVNSHYEKSLISTNLIRLSLDNHKVNPLYFVLAMKFFANKIGKLKTGSENAFTHMNTGVLTNLVLQIPPIQLQNQFADRIQKIEAQKQLAEESLAKSQELFQSLLKESFNS